jgi:hypothetical protein
MENTKQQTGVVTAAAEELVANRYTPDAQERMARLRSMAAEFPDDADPRPLTPAEMRIARLTTTAALEKAALFAEAAPQIGSTAVDPAQLRDTIAFELAYEGLRDQALALARRIDHAILRRKLRAVRGVRGLYRLGKGYVTLDAGDAVRPELAEMKRTLVRPRRRKLAVPPEPPDAVKAKK